MIVLDYLAVGVLTAAVVFCVGWARRDSRQRCACCDPVEWPVELPKARIYRRSLR